MTARASTTPAPPAARPLAPVWRDPWGWLAALSVAPLVLRSLGAPLGEPVAEDFDFLRHVRLLGEHSLLDGGGSLAFWRPVAHQLYYLALGGLILDHPRVVSAIHVALLALSAVLLYRALRPGWGGPRAAAAASFPFLTESVRTVISWPSHGVEVGALLFTAAALHEASRRRLATTLLALLLGLLCKEPVLVAALLIPWMPGRLAGTGDSREAPALRERLRWTLATASLGLAWGLVYLYVRRTAGLALPHALESSPSTLDVPFHERTLWAAWNGARALMSLPAAAAPGDAFWGLGALAIVAAAMVLVAARPAARARAGPALPWIAWGLAWYALSSATLGALFPFWAPNRVLLGSVGLGIATVALLGSALPALPAALVTLRLAAFAIAPGPSRWVTIEAAPTGAFMDFPQLTRLQLLMSQTRAALREKYPGLSHSTTILWSNMPHGAVYAFGGDRALQVWYGDTTLHWTGLEEALAGPGRSFRGMAQFQRLHSPQVAVLDSAAVATLADADSAIARGDLVPALGLLDRAESQAAGSGAVLFLSNVGAARATALDQLGRTPEAEREARHAVALMPENGRARLTLASIRAGAGDLDEVRRQLDTLSVLLPGDTLVERLVRLLPSRPHR